MSIIHHHLKAIPDYLKVSENDPEDPRITFILEEYRDLKGQGVELPDITPDTTMSEVKDALDKASYNHTTELMGFIVRYNNKFLKVKYEEEKPVDKKEIYKYIVIIGSIAFFIIFLLTMLYVAVSGDTGFASNMVNSIMGFAGPIFTAIFGENPPPM